jgi:hypothetical protein
MLSRFMTIPSQARWKFYTLRALAAVLLVLAAVMFVLRPNNFGIRSLSLLAILLSLWLVRRSSAYAWRALGRVETGLPATGTVGLLAWILAAASLAACGVSYFLMYRDALHGGKEVWPVYVFGVAALSLVVTVGNVVVRIFR